MTLLIGFGGLGGFGGLVFMDFLGSEAREAGDAKVTFNWYRVSFCSFGWLY